ncbi:hemin uptake protein HemP [Ramlibacter henchirensis]|uniref:Hemin uptake protein HemP n=1 Tax=Ramlibacter henchirensis TaxID=204072 RepID=A0A4Z0BNT4_9BURK|nr:hemin uptake protein HemP [Ramlibacter henchirensis]TFZ00481.1 hemin uptake protein HemP [Ramlibacter henchirensis]
MSPTRPTPRPQAQPETAPGTAQACLPARPPLVESSQLFQGHRAVEIHHNGELYRLQATRTGKLILTK